MEAAKRGIQIPALDGFRGIAILMVMVYHFTIYSGMQPYGVTDTLFYKLAGTGWCGVDLFFVLSGFLITGILFDAKESRYYFRNFYIRRVLRIFPLYYGSLLVAFVLLPLILSPSLNYQQMLEEQSWYWYYLTNVIIAVRGWPSVLAFGHFWSLAVEEQFYLLWPFVLFLFGRKKLMLICVVCVVMSLGVRLGLTLTGHSLAAYVLTPARMDPLALGSLIALIARGPHGLTKLSRWAWPIAGSTILILGPLFLLRRGLRAENDIVVQTIGYSLFALLFGAVLIIALTISSSSRLGTVFNSSGLRFFGRYSYGLYIFHHVIVFWVAQHVFSVERFPRLLGSQLPGLLLFITLCSVVSVGVALLSWHFFEQPFLKLKNLFPYNQSEIVTVEHVKQTV